MPDPTPIYLDPSYTREERVRDLLARMTLDDGLAGRGHL